MGKKGAKTMTKRYVKMPRVLFAACMMFAMSGLSVFAAWFDNPAVSATVNVGETGTDPHFINISEDGAFLLVDLHASNTASPVQLYSVAELLAASGTTNKLAMASAKAPDFFGAGTGTGGWKGGAVSAKLGVAIPGSGKSSGALYTAFSVPSFGWMTNETAFALSGFGDAGFDGLDFNAAGTRLYVNQYASGNRNKILAYDTASLKSAHMLSLLSTKTVSEVTRIRNLSCYTIKGKDLIYFGEGAVSGSNNSVYVYDPAADAVTVLVTDATLFDGDIMNVKLSHVASGSPTLYVQTDNGRLHVFLLAPDGKSVTSAKPAKSFTPAQCAAFCGLSGVPSNASYVKFRNFEVTDDGSAAFFIFLNGGASGVTSPGLCVVKSDSNEDAYISTSPEYTTTGNGNVLFSDYFFGANSRIEVDYAYRDGSYGFIFSPWESGSGSRSGIWRNNGTYTYFVGNRNDGIASVRLLDTDRHMQCIDAKNKKGFIATGSVTNEVDFASYNITFSTCNWPIMFLGAATGSTGALRVNTTHYARAKIYGAKIYENDVLVRDYVPAIVNGVPCLYDRVNGSIAAETRDGFAQPGFGGEVMRLAGDSYIQLATSGTVADMGINTGYRMKPTSRVEADCQLTVSGECRPFGAWNHESTFKNLIWTPGGKVTFFLNAGYAARVETTFKPGTDRKTFVLDAPAMKFYVVKDGNIHATVAATNSAPTAEASDPLALFADCNNADCTSFAQPATGMKCYSFKALEDGMIVTNFVPFLSIDGACMKDAITGGIITPKVPRYFTFRLDENPNADESYVINTVNTRTTGFNTGCYPSSKSRVECDIDVSYTAGTQRPVGCWNLFTSGVKLRFLTYVTGGKFQYFLNSGTGSSTVTADMERHTHVFDFVNNKAQLYTGDTVVHEVAGTAAVATDYASVPVSLFADNNGSGTFNDGCLAGARFWGLKTYEDGVLIHDFVPATANGVGGIGDKMTGRFLPCGDSFAAAGGLWECVSDAYVESDGTQVLNTGYHANKSSRIEVDFMPLNNVSVCYFGCYPGNDGNNYTVWNAPPFVRFTERGNTRDYASRFRAQNTRLTSVVDFAGDSQYIKLGGVKMSHLEYDMSSRPFASDWTSANPLGICGGIANADGTSISTAPVAAAMRVYAVRIYESDALVHLFLPYSGTDGVGLCDVITGAKAFKHSASVSDPVYVAGPLAVTAADVTALGTMGPGNFSIRKGTVATATASAPGATTYRWTRNGVTIGETTDGKLGLGWRKQSETAVFTVTPVYRTATGNIDGETVSFTVDCPALSSKIVIR